MKFFRLILYFFFIFQYLYAQPINIKNDLNTTDKLLLEAIHYMDENNLSMAKKNARDVMEILFKNNKIYDTRMIDAYNILVFTYLEKGDIKNAKNLLGKALSIQDEIKKPHNALISTYIIAALISKVEKKYTEAIHYYQKTLELMKELNSTQYHTDIQKRSLKEIKLLSSLAKDEIVYREFSFLDFISKIKENSPYISIDEYINKNLKPTECIQGLCKKVKREYFKIDNIYTEYLKNPSQTKESIFDFYKITNFNYLFNTMGVCALLNKDTSNRNAILSKLNNDLLSIIKNSKNPLELDMVISNYKDFDKILNISSGFCKTNSCLTKAYFFKKLQIYAEIQLKEQNPKLVSSIPKNKKKILYKRYEYFKKYFNEYFSTMVNIIKLNNHNAWKKYLNKLTTTLKNKDAIINREGENGRAKVWATRVALYFKTIFDNYNTLFYSPVQNFHSTPKEISK